MTGLFLNASTAITPKNITGTVDANGKVDLTTEYDVLLKAGANQCRLTCTTELSSAGTEKRGHAYDPQTGRFALASTAYSPVTATGDCGLVTAAGYDLAPGTGWYLTCALSLPPVRPQTAVASLAKRIKAEGKTVLLKKSVVTNAGQTAVASVTWSTKKSAKGTRAKHATWKTKRSGEIVIITTRAAKRMYVKFALTAPAVHGYTAYQYTKTRRLDTSRRATELR